jgi:4-diphosphocytidyl-2-C-methyl-D-erythritol kinase
LEEVIQKPVENWQGELYNDFEGPVFERYPELAEIKRKILGMGAVYASMTGSGSAIFGIFCKGKLPVAHIDFPECFVWDSR